MCEKFQNQWLKYQSKIIKASFIFFFQNSTEKNIFFNKTLDWFSSKIKNQSEIDFVKNRSMY